MIVNTLFQTVCRVGIFMICAQAIVHFRPQESYEKYLKLLVSIMVLIQLFLPVGEFFWGEGKKQAAEALVSFGEELERSMQEAEESAGDMEQKLQQMTLEEIRRQAEAAGQNGSGTTGQTESRAAEVTGQTESRAAEVTGQTGSQAAEAAGQTDGEAGQTGEIMIENVQIKAVDGGLVWVEIGKGL